jgi:MFS transporter, DHA2 family, multidrug resistance protein
MVLSAAVRLVVNALQPGMRARARSHYSGHQTTTEPTPPNCQRTFTNAGLGQEKSRGQRPPTEPYDTVENLDRADGDGPMTAADATAPAPDAIWKPRYNPWLIAGTVTLAAFMEILDTTIVNVAPRYIAGDLAVSNDDATWVLTSYLVSNGIVLTISGWLGDALGRKRYFLICITIFTVFSLLCGTSTSLAELIVFRLAQGFFGGGMQPNQQSIILDTFPPEKRGAAFGVAAFATVVAPVLGPTLGGYIVDQWSWRWIFFINIPTGLIAVFLVSVLVEDPPWVRKKKSRGIDFVGLSLITICLGCLQIMMDRGEDDDWFGSNFIRLISNSHFGILKL